MDGATEMKSSEGEADGQVVPSNTIISSMDAVTDASIRSEDEAHNKTSQSDLSFAPAAPSTTGVNLEEFHLFPKLAAELRLIIWRFAMPEGRRHQPFGQESFPHGSGPCNVTRNRGHRQITVSRSLTPVILHVCHESREEGLKIYIPHTLELVNWHGSVPTNLTTTSYFAPSRDFFYFGSSSGLSRIGSSSCAIYRAPGYLDDLYGRFRRNSIHFVQQFSIIKDCRMLKFAPEAWRQISDMPLFPETILNDYQFLEEIVIEQESLGFNRAFQLERLRRMEHTIVHAAGGRVGHPEEITEEFLDFLESCCQSEILEEQKVVSMRAMTVRCIGKMRSKWEETMESWDEEAGIIAPGRKAPKLTINIDVPEKLETFSEMIERVVLRRRRDT